MRVATDAADLVALNAQRLSGAVVAARTRARVAARLAAVGVLRRERADPAGRMRGLTRFVPAMPIDWWQVAQRDVVWQVVHAPGSARASSA